MIEKTFASSAMSASGKASATTIPETDVLIIGAGIAGLTAAIEASDRGRK